MELEIYFDRLAQIGLIELFEHSGVTDYHVHYQTNDGRTIYDDQVEHSCRNTLNILKIWTSEKFAEMTLKFQQGGLI